MPMIEFTVPGEPQGKARGRTFIHNKTGKFTTKTPDKTVLYENLIKTMFLQSKCKPYEARKPLEMVVVAKYGVPKSKGKREREAMLTGDIRPTKKPDADNILKVVADALNGLAYHDDTQIVKAMVVKWYSTEPGVDVRIQEVNNNAQTSI